MQQNAKNLLENIHTSKPLKIVTCDSFRRD